jgi:hypothetical protein
MFFDMAVVLKATQEAPAAAPLGSSSLPGTLAKSEILETPGNLTSLGKNQSLTVGVSQSFQRMCMGPGSQP